MCGSQRNCFLRVKSQRGGELKRKLQPSHAALQRFKHFHPRLPLYILLFPLRSRITGCLSRVEKPGILISLTQLSHWPLCAIIALPVQLGGLSMISVVPAGQPGFLASVFVDTMGQPKSLACNMFSVPAGLTLLGAKNKNSSGQRFVLHSFDQNSPVYFQSSKYIFKILVQVCA